MIYLDTSAFMKRVWDEVGSVELKDHIEHREDLVSSRLLVTEARRSATRIDPTTLARVDVLMVPFALIGVTDAVIESASRLPGTHLRSLDAIHVATALLLGDELDELVTYDDRLADAAREHGITVVAPGT